MTSDWNVMQCIHKYIRSLTLFGRYMQRSAAIVTMDKNRWLLRDVAVLNYLMRHEDIIFGHFNVPVGTSPTKHILMLSNQITNVVTTQQPMSYSLGTLYTATIAKCTLCDNDVTIKKQSMCKIIRWRARYNWHRDFDEVLQILQSQFLSWVPWKLQGKIKNLCFRLSESRRVFLYKSLSVQYWSARSTHQYETEMSCQFHR